MRVTVAYAEPAVQYLQTLDLPDGTTVRDAIERCGVLTRFPHIDIERQKVGIFGKVTALETGVSEGDRVEIYRSITADPRTVPRRGGGDDEEED